MQKEYSRILVETIDYQIEELSETLISLKDSLNNASKSSAGDKHETARAHVQLEMEQIGQQLAIKEKMKIDLLKMLDFGQKAKVSAGSFVKTSKGDFLLSVALGQIKGSTAIAISLHAPLAQALLNRVKGETITLNGNEFRILDIK